MLLHRQHSQMGAAVARRAELRLMAEAVTPPEELPSWQWFNPRRMAVRHVTVAGEPEYGRSALGGFVQHGKLCEADDGFRHPNARMKPSKPRPLSDRAVLEGWTVCSSSAVAVAVATVRGCRFPIGEVFSDDFRFCNEERISGAPYCAFHAEKCSCVRGRHL